MRFAAPKSFLSLALFSLTLPVHAQNLAANGSFESPGFSSFSDFVLLTNGDTSITGWTVGDDGFGEAPFWAKAPTYPTSDGNYSVFLNQGSSIQTTFAATAGVTYTVAFDYFAGSPGFIADYLPLQLQVAGVSTTFTDISGNTSWKSGTYQFTAAATDANASLRFFNPSQTFTTFAAYGLDNVRLTTAPVPEAGAMVWAASGILSGILLRRIQGAKSRRRLSV
jgi:hypothetical protein